MQNKGTLFVISPSEQFNRFLKKKKYHFRVVGGRNEVLVCLNYTQGNYAGCIGLSASLKLGPRNYIYI